MVTSQVRNAGQNLNIKTDNTACPRVNSLYNWEQP